MTLDGHEIFLLVDSIGLPLNIIVLELREKGLSFNIAEFIESARDAGWKRMRVYNMVLYSGIMQNNKEFRKKLILFISHYYD